MPFISPTFMFCDSGPRSNYALQRTRPSHCGCNHSLPRAGALRLGRWAHIMKPWSSPRQLWQPSRLRCALMTSSP